jgi:thymidylate synthase (FAD)
MNRIKVLDKGFVELVEHMGTDLSVVNAARVSFSKESDWDMGDPVVVEESNYPHSRSYDVWTEYPDKKLSERDTKLINYLAKHNHWTPFGQVNVKLRIKMPIFVARQAMRSNIGIVWNEESRRYIDSKPEFYEPDVWRGRPEGSIKQGSADKVLLGPKSEEMVRDADWYSRCAYDHLLDIGVAPEQARIILPQSTYTTVIGNFTLAAAARFVGLRSDPHAQKEIQDYARAMSEIISPLFPVSWDALVGEK